MTGTILNDLLTEIQYHLLETPNSGSSYSSGQWDRNEVLSYFRNRQNQFFKDTAALLKRSSIAYTPGALRQPLPSDWAITQRMVWHDTDGSFKELPRSDGWDLDYGSPTWNVVTSAKPEVYADEELPSLQFIAAPVPTNIGSPEILYVYQDPLFPATTNSTMRIDEFAPYPRVPGMPSQDRYRWTSVGLSISLPIDILLPIEFSSVIKYGVMADMLAKVGRGQDLTRAAYCESRFQEGIEAIKLAISGWQGG